MLDRQQILDGLIAEKTNLVSELTSAQAEFDRLKKRITEIEQVSSALETVIKSLSGNAPPTIINADNVESESEEIQVPEVEEFQLQPKNERRSLRKTGRDHFTELSQEYTKKDVADLLLKYHPELNGTINENSLRNVVVQFVELKWAQVKVQSSGTSLQIYEKIV